MQQSVRPRRTKASGLAGPKSWPARPELQSRFARNILGSPCGGTISCRNGVKPQGRQRAPHPELQISWRRWGRRRVISSGVAIRKNLRAACRGCGLFEREDSVWPGRFGRSKNSRGPARIFSGSRMRILRERCLYFTTAVNAAGPVSFLTSTQPLIACIGSYDQ